MAAVYTKKLRDPKKVWKKKYIELGNKGASVKEVQVFLKWWFKIKLKVDGKFKSVDKKYTMKFQEYMGITVDGKWGHETWKKAVTITPKIRFMFLVKKYNSYIKKHGKHFKRSDSVEKSYSEAVEKVKEGKTAHVNCCTPINWAFRDIGMDPYSIWSKNGTFKDKFRGTMTKHLKRITKGAAVGYTVKQAVDNGLLEEGDIISFKSLTHTVAYTGSGYKVYDSGSAAERRGYEKVGATLDYSTVGSYKDKKISEILRWK